MGAPARAGAGAAAAGALPLAAAPPVAVAVAAEAAGLLGTLSVGSAKVMKFLGAARTVSASAVCLWSCSAYPWLVT